MGWLDEIMGNEFAEALQKLLIRGGDKESPHPLHCPMPAANTFSVCVVLETELRA
jgi:hypothetical protein